MAEDRNDPSSFFGVIWESIDPIHAVTYWNQASFSWIERHTEGDGTMMLRHMNVK